MNYKEHDIRTNLCSKTGHRRYQFTVDGEVVYETDDSLMYDALHGDETFWDDDDYKRAEEACEFILNQMEDYIIYLEHDFNDEFKDRHYMNNTCYSKSDERAWSKDIDDAKLFHSRSYAEECVVVINRYLYDCDIDAKAVVYNLKEFKQ